MEHRDTYPQAPNAIAARRRKFVAMATLALLAGCKAIPKGVPDVAPPPPVVVEPSPDVLPTDTERHRVALLVPMTGANSAVGQAIANAATMALLDTNAQNLRVTTYDTTAGAASAAQRAIADGNKLILGPLLSSDIAAVSAAAAAAKVPVISYSNDAGASARNVYIMGSIPGQSVLRTVTWAKAQGAGRFAALIPGGEYGQRASVALQGAVRSTGVSLVATETYDRSNTSIVSAARRLVAKGGFDAVLLADGGRIAAQAAPVLRPAGAANGPRLLGTELWSGESVIATTPGLRGAWFAAVSDSRFKQFSDSYKTRFGAAPYRIATLGYDSVLLTLRVAREWKPGAVFPTARMADKGGFLGLDGPFRFGPDGVVDRAFEVREVRVAGVTVVSPAPARFED